MRTAELIEFANAVFGQPPADAFAHHLEMDVQFDALSEQAEHAADIAEMLTILFSYGVRILFSSTGSVDISTLGAEEIALMQRYFNSIGFSFTLTIDECDTPRRSHFSEAGRHLSDISFHLYRDDKVFNLSFDFVPEPEQLDSVHH
jgi:hypothetical protein